MARRRFFVDTVRGGQAYIEGEDAHHLTRVLRVEAGQNYEISDNQNVYLARIEAARKDLVTFSIVEKLPHPDPTVRLVLYASLIRFERFELLIEKATELGVARIIPIETGRTEKGLDRAAPKRAARWNRIAREASEQSRRSTLPDIAAVAPFRDALAASSGYRFFLDEDPAAPPIFAALPTHCVISDEVSLLVGPEGGWTDRERTEAAEFNLGRVSLGSTILRTETAAIAALAILNAAWQITHPADFPTNPYAVAE